MPINILNVVRYPIGGIRNYLRYTYSKLDAAIYRATVLTVDRPEAALLAAGMAPLEVELITVSESASAARLAFKLRELLRRRTFQVVHSQGATAGIVTALASAHANVPHILTLHETFREEQFAGAAGAVKRRVLASLMGRADSIIVVSHDALENLRQHVPLSPAALARVEVIRNGVAVDALLRDAQGPAKGLPLREDLAPATRLIGYVGRFMPEKGFDVLIEAVAKLRDRATQLPPFKIVAVNDGAFVNEYREQISSLGLEAFFHFTGFQSTVAGVLVALDAVVMPSLREACPLVAMETMVLGCVLIASDCVGLREITTGTPAIRSAAGDPSSLARAIEQLLADPQSHRQAARAYMPVAQREFDSGVTSRRLSELINHGLDRHQRSRAS